MPVPREDWLVQDYPAPDSDAGVGTRDEKKHKGPSVIPFRNVLLHVW
jgi:hypothetical protein